MMRKIHTSSRVRYSLTRPSPTIISSITVMSFPQFCFAPPALLLVLFLPPPYPWVRPVITRPAPRNLHHTRGMIMVTTPLATRPAAQRKDPFLEVRKDVR